MGKTKKGGTHGYQQLEHLDTPKHIQGIVQLGTNGITYDSRSQFKSKTFTINDPIKRVTGNVTRVELINVVTESISTACLQLEYALADYATMVVFITGAEINELYKNISEDTKVLCNYARSLNDIINPQYARNGNTNRFTFTWIAEGRVKSKFLLYPVADSSSFTCTSDAFIRTDVIHITLNYQNNKTQYKCDISKDIKFRNIPSQSMFALSTSFTINKATEYTFKENASYFYYDSFYKEKEKMYYVKVCQLAYIDLNDDLDTSLNFDVYNISNVSSTVLRNLRVKVLPFYGSINGCSFLHLKFVFDALPNYILSIFLTGDNISQIIEHDNQRLLCGTNVQKPFDRKKLRLNNAVTYKHNPDIVFNISNVKVQVTGTPSLHINATIARIARIARQGHTFDFEYIAKKQFKVYVNPLADATAPRRAAPSQSQPGLQAALRAAQAAQAPGVEPSQPRKSPPPPPPPSPRSSSDVLENVLYIQKKDNEQQIIFTEQFVFCTSNKPQALSQELSTEGPRSASASASAGGKKSQGKSVKRIGGRRKPRAA